jgi:ABC-type multidrug transport system fused ATPase/permease subunit
VTLRIAPGEAVGVAGASGGGKSSLCMLAMGLLRPTRGVVAIGGVDLADLTPESWRGLAAYVPQECRLILGSVADNIRFFRSDVTAAEIVAAAKAAHLHDEIVALPQGYATIIGPSSRDLSGGQKQRLVLARALAGQPGLLVLDEPSSALDPRSEGLIIETLRALKGRTALLVIAHRPATLSFCDRVLLLEHGALALVEDRRERPVAAAGEQQP